MRVIIVDLRVTGVQEVVSESVRSFFVGRGKKGCVPKSRGDIYAKEVSPPRGTFDG